MNSKNFLAAVWFVVALQGSEATVYRLSGVMDPGQATTNPSDVGGGSGSIFGTYDDDTNLLSYRIEWDGLTSAVTNMHFHVGAPGVSGGVDLPVPGPWASPQTASGIVLDASEEANLLAGNWYLNIHTTNFGGGEIRGQVTVTEAGFPALALELVAEGQFGAPTTVTHAGDGSGRLFVADQRGTIHILEDGVVLPEPFLNIGDRLVPERPGFDERGLLGLAFHPDFEVPAAAGEGCFYVYYSAPSPNAPGSAGDPVDHMSVVAEFRVSGGDPDVADPDSERILFTFDQPQFNHDAGQIAFGPDDALLYVATGDGGSSNDNNAGHTGGSAARPTDGLGNSQDRTNLLGKILRVDPLGTNGPGGAYGIPATNPFVGEGGGVREEIYAYGLRNPWRISFDDGPGGTNRLFCADVGQGRVEEINLIVPGGNYGWRNREGTFNPDFSTDAPALTGNVVDPVAQYAHPGVVIGTPELPQVGISVTGGFVYRGAEIPRLFGTYIFADWSDGFSSPNGTLLGLEETGFGVFDLSVLQVAGGNPIGRFIPTLGEDESGELYVATKTSLAPSAPDPATGLPAGQLFRIVAADPVTAALTAAKDNSIYEELTGNSNGAGAIFAGLTNGTFSGSQDVRRGLVEFDLAALPEGAGVIEASLSLRVAMTMTPSAEFTLHALQKEWGEGGSLGAGQGAPAETGEATWSHARFGTVPWDNPGGDFTAAASASSTVDGVGLYSWSSAGMVADVQAWLDTPAGNHGWLMRGEESTPSVKMFDSRTAATLANRPTLTISYQPPPVLTRRQEWERQFFPVGTFLPADGDGEADQIGLLFEYGWDLNPNIRDSWTDYLRVDADPGASAIDVEFHRDPRAVDLTYILESGGDLTTWTPRVTVTSGGAPTGEAFESEEVDPGNAELRIVHARITIPPEEDEAHYVRLRLVRP